MTGNPAHGADCLREGFRLITEPGLRSFVIWPLLINICVFSAVLYYSYQQTVEWINQAMDWLPEWLGFLDWVFWILFVLVFAVVLVYGFTLVANLIGAPFNGLLAERVEVRLTGQALAPTGWGDVAGIIVRSLKRELAKLGYFLPRAIGLLILGFIPGINLVVPVLWLMFSAWMMAIQYVDFPADNGGTSFSALRQSMSQDRLTALGLGGSILLMSMVPVVNLLVMPASVAGATVYWVRRQQARARPGAAKQSGQSA